MKKYIAGLSFLLASNVVFAHPGHPLQSLYAGFTHPLTGIDHLLVMLAVGMWASSMQGRARWQMPTLFFLMMLLGGVLAKLGFSLPLLETGIAGSVLAMGLLLVMGSRLNVALQFGSVALFAIYHGLAHGVELQQQQAWFAFGAMLLATGLLHAIGYWVGIQRYLFQSYIKQGFAYGLMLMGALLLVY